MGNDKRCSSTNSGKIALAFLLIIVGGVFLAFDSGVLSSQLKSIILSWQMLLIVIGIFSFFKRKILEGFILASLGIVFILPVVTRKFPGLFNGFTFDIHLSWPVILIIIGVAILLKNLFSKKNEETKTADNGEETVFSNISSNKTISKNLLFGSSEEILLSPEFVSAELNVAFGEIKIDMRKVKNLNENNMLEANAIFGSIIIYLPDNWNVNFNVDSVFAGVQDKRNIIISESDVEKPSLNIKGGCIFGSIEIRN